jgi:FkbM family methyltransferase
METVKKTFRTVVDVGANIGIFGHYMVNHCGAVKPEKMICFEPYKESYDILCQNVPRGRNYQIAVGSKNEEAVQLGAYDATNKGMNRMVSLGDCSTTISTNDQIEVPTEVQQVTLDSFLGHDVDDIDLIKIDVEGYENEVLLGATEILKTHEPDIFLELHGGFSPCAIRRFHDEVWPILRDWYGYESVYLFPEHDFVGGSPVVLSTDERWKDPHMRLPAIDRRPVAFKAQI